MLCYRTTELLITRRTDEQTIDYRIKDQGYLTVGHQTSAVGCMHIFTV